MKLQKKINIVIILLAIILVSIISFVGVYNKYQNKMINVIPNYNVGTNLDGYRKAVIEVDTSDSKKAKTEEGNNASDAKKAEKTQDEKNREYEKSLEIIKKRLSYLKVKDYTVSLDKNTGRIEIMLPEENDTDTVLSGLAETGKFEVVDSTNSEVLLTNSDISKAEIVKDNKGTVTNLVLNVTFNSNGTKKFKDITKNYQNQVVENVNLNGTSNTTTGDNTKTNKKVTIKLDGSTLLQTSFSNIVDSGILSLTIGSSDSEVASFEDQYIGAKNLAALISNESLPIKYKVKTNYYIMSPLNKYNVIYLVYAGIAIALIISLALIIKFRLNGVIGTILSIGYMACLLIIIRYANVELSIEAMFGFIVAFMIGTIFNIFACSEFNKTNMTDKELQSVKNKVFKRFVLSLVPISIFALIACLFSLSSLFSFGTVLFWAIVIAIIYYCSLTLILMNSMHKRK